MLDGLAYLQLQEAATARILAHYRIERRYPGSPADAMARVARAWELVAADYAIDHQPAPTLLGYAVRIARAAAASIEARPPYWRRRPE